MPALFEFLVSNSIVVAIMAVGLGLFGFVCRKPALLHCLWVLVLVKLLTPPIVPVNVPAPSWIATTDESGDAGEHVDVSFAWDSALSPASSTNPDEGLDGTAFDDFQSASSSFPTTPHENRNSESHVSVPLKDIESDIKRVAQADHSPTQDASFAAKSLSFFQTARPILPAISLAGSLFYLMLVGMRCLRFRKTLRAASCADD